MKKTINKKTVSMDDLIREMTIEKIVIKSYPPFVYVVICGYINDDYNKIGFTVGENGIEYLDCNDEWVSVDMTIVDLTIFLTKYADKLTTE